MRRVLRALVREVLPGGRPAPGLAERWRGHTIPATVWAESAAALAAREAGTTPAAELARALAAD